MVMVWLYRQLNFINSAVKSFFRCKHLRDWGEVHKIKMTSFKMKNAISRNAIEP